MVGFRCVVGENFYADQAEGEEIVVRQHKHHDCVSEKKNCVPDCVHVAEHQGVATTQLAQ